MSFSGESKNGSYHTLYDTYEHYSTWQDPGLVYGATLARVTGRAALRIANAPRLPFEFTGFEDNIALYINELEEFAKYMRGDTKQTNRLLADGSYAAARNPNTTFGLPVRKEPVPHFNFSPLRNVLVRLQRAANAFDESANGSVATSEEINRLLFTSERLLTRADSLDGRSWYKHHIYAPGYYSGYGVKTIPGVREAIEQRRYELVEPQIEIAADVLNLMSNRIELLNPKIRSKR